MRSFDVEKHAGSAKRSVMIKAVNQIFQNNRIQQKFSY